jgi:hypothetical protein
MTTTTTTAAQLHKIVKATGLERSKRLPVTRNHRGQVVQSAGGGWTTGYRFDTYQLTQVTQFAIKAESGSLRTAARNAEAIRQALTTAGIDWKPGAFTTTETLVEVPR